MSTTALSFWTVWVQHWSVDLERRPYVSLRFGAPEKLGETISGEIVYTNLGKVPASNIKSSFYIATDKDLENKALDRKEMGYRHIAFLAPEETDSVSRPIPLSPEARSYHIDVVVSYEGIGRGKRYWTRAGKTFWVGLMRESRYGAYTGEIASDYIDALGDWDRNTNFNVPKPTGTNFDKQK